MMKQSKEMVISFVLLAFLCSCNNNDRLIKEVQALSGRKITFPTGYESLSYHESLSVDSLLTKDIKMVSYIDDFPCT